MEASWENASAIFASIPNKNGWFWTWQKLEETFSAPVAAGKSIKNVA
jgi:hypothetical protein